MNAFQKCTPDFQFKVPHRNWQLALSQLYGTLTFAEPGDVVCLTGPSRVGKSTLLRAVMKMLLGDHDFQKTGLLPVVRASAANTGPYGAFSTRAFSQRMLDAIEHPIHSSTTILASISDSNYDRRTEGLLRLSLERGLLARQTRFLLVDEAHHMAYGARATLAPHAVLDSFKCLAEDTQVVLILVGAYPILGMLQNSPHLLGRKAQIHFPRYHLEQSDVLVFGDILGCYDEVIPWAHAGDSLQDHAELLYNGSLGCIGLLRGWLKRACAFSINDKNGFSEKYLYQTMLSKQELTKISEEIVGGETLLASFESTPEIKSDSDTKKKIKPRRQQKPFQRKPVRYQVGNRVKENR